MNTVFARDSNDKGEICISDCSFRGLMDDPAVKGDRVAFIRPDWII